MPETTVTFSVDIGLVKARIQYDIDEAYCPTDRGTQELPTPVNIRVLEVVEITIIPEAPGMVIGKLFPGDWYGDHQREYAQYAIDTDPTIVHTAIWENEGRRVAG